MHLRRLQQDGLCACCGFIGPVFQDVELVDGQYMTVDLDRAALPPLCDPCDYAQRRWEARQYQIKHPAFGYPFAEGPPRTPPVRRAGDFPLAADGWPA